MSDEIITSPPTPPTAVPGAGRTTTPIWIVLLLLVLLFLGGLYFDEHGGWFSAQVYAPYVSTDEVELYQPKSGAAAALARGKVVYDQVCGICHGPDGLGKPGQAPPLAGSEWVNAKGFDRLAHIPLAGLNGHLTVAGKDWNMSMAAMCPSSTHERRPDEDHARVRRPIPYPPSGAGRDEGERISSLNFVSI